jgi:hypothetical protein
MSLDARQERKRKAIFDSALEDWQGRSATSTSQSIRRGLASAQQTRLGMRDAMQGVRRSSREDDDTRLASNNPDEELSNFYGGWATAIDEAFGAGEDKPSEMSGEDAKAKRPPRISQDEVEDGVPIPDFDIETDLDMAAKALGFVESTNKYDAVGEVIKDKNSMYYGDRAYGMYQVMGKNIPVWTKQYLGTKMTKEQFLADSAAQDKLVRAFITEKYNQYGNIEDAVSVWFTGRPLKKATEEGAADQNISVNEYVRRFRKEFFNLLEG